MNSGLLFRLTAAFEILTGFVLVAVPELAVGLLIGEGVGPIGIWVTRVLAIALMALGIAAWKPAGSDARFPPRAGLCLYNVGVAVILAIIGLSASSVGILLWPTAALHLALSVLSLAYLKKAPG